MSFKGGRGYAPGTAGRAKPSDGRSQAHARHSGALRDENVGTPRIRRRLCLLRRRSSSKGYALPGWTKAALSGNDGHARRDPPQSQHSLRGRDTHVLFRFGLHLTPVSSKTRQ